MPYTAAQLSSFFTLTNGGIAPDANTNALIATYALQDASGTITDNQALHLAVQSASPTVPGYNSPASTVEVALASYEFATGAIPSAAGLNYLLGNPGSGLQTSFYAGFNQEARYENMMINLEATPASAVSTSFAATYGAMTFAQAVTAAYAKIIGSAAVSTPGGIAAIADIASRQAYFQALAAQNPTLNQTAATDAAMIGYILNEAVKADVGVYATALDNFNFNLATGGAVNYATDITSTYSNTSPYAGAGSASVGAPSGTINAATLGSGVTGVTFNSNATAAVTINNAPTAFTLNEGAFNNGQAITLNQAGTGTTDSLTLSALSPTGNQNINGFENINYSTGVASTIANANLSASVGGTETLNVSGAGNTTFNNLALTGTGTTINAVGSGSLTVNNVVANTINAASSGGLFMTSADTNVATGVIGATITGSTLNANTIYGSAGNDTITGGTKGGDIVVTAGGADVINLGVGHASDTIYLGNFSGAVPTSVGAGSIVSNRDVAQAGYFGSAVGATTNLAGLSNVTGTSADQSAITGFRPGNGGDVLVFSKGEWGVGTGANGLTNGDGSTVVANGNAIVSSVTTGATISASSNFLELNGQSFNNAAALATALHSATLSLSANLNSGTATHILMAYQDSVGNAHIADVDFSNATGAATASSNLLTEHASDMVVLAGVSLNSLTAANVLFIG